MVIARALLIACVCVPGICFAQSQQETADDAIEWAEGANSEVVEAAEAGDPIDVTPGFAGTDLSQSDYYDNQSPGGLESDGFTAVITSGDETIGYAWDQANTPVLEFSEDDPLLVDSWAIQDNTSVVEGELLTTSNECSDGDVGTEETTIERCSAWVLPEEGSCSSTLTVTAEVTTAVYDAVLNVFLDAGNPDQPGAIGGSFRLHGSPGTLVDYGFGTNGEVIGIVNLSNSMSLPTDFNCANITDTSFTTSGSFHSISGPTCQPGGRSFASVFFFPGATNGGNINFRIEVLGNPVFTDTWSDGCAGLDDCEAQGPPVCVEGPEERMITANNGVDYPVFRDCWRYDTAMTCAGTTATDEGYCSELVSRGCSPIDSQCEADGTCEHTYECPLDGWSEPAEDCTDTSFALQGVEFDTSVEQSGDFGVAAANLQAMEEAVLDMDSAGVTCTETPVGSGEYNCVGDLLIFNGEDRRCSKKALGFANCCSRSGWGLGWASDCSSEEDILRTQRAEGQCVYVGTYCSDDSIFGCLEKTETNCCFRSKLGRIIHEQGRPQIGYGWGSAEAPECEGFSEEQLAALDFGAIDFSEYFADAFANVTGGPDSAAMESIIDAYITTLSGSSCSQFDPGYPDC
ncbi:MAG: conjugal transfer protein TraN [Pseudomonadota bacterium]